MNYHILSLCMPSTWGDSKNSCPSTVGTSGRPGLTNWGNKKEKKLLQLPNHILLYTQKRLLLNLPASGKSRFQGTWPSFVFSWHFIKNRSQDSRKANHLILIQQCCLWIKTLKAKTWGLQKWILWGIQDYSWLLSEGAGKNLATFDNRCSFSVGKICFQVKFFRSP